MLLSTLFMRNEREREEVSPSLKSIQAITRCILFFEHYFTRINITKIVLRPLPEQGLPILPESFDYQRWISSQTIRLCPCNIVLWRKQNIAVLLIETAPKDMAAGSTH
jgi:hypothetical protein